MVLISAMNWMNLENIIVSEISHSKKTNIERFHLVEMFTVGRSIEIESRLVASWSRGGKGYGNV